MIQPYSAIIMILDPVEIVIRIYTTSSRLSNKIWKTHDWSVILSMCHNLTISIQILKFHALQRAGLVEVQARKLVSDNRPKRAGPCTLFHLMTGK